MNRNDFENMFADSSRLHLPRVGINPWLSLSFLLACLAAICFVAWRVLK